MRSGRLFFFFLFILGLSQVACHKNASSEQMPFLKASTTSLSESYKGGKDSIEINSDGAWTLTVPSWITTSNSTGMAGTTIVYLYFQVNTNSKGLSGSVVINPENSQVARVTIKVLQEGWAPYLKINTISLSEAPDGQHDSVAIESNVQWIFSLPDNAAWLSATRGADISGKTKIYFTSAPNNQGILRTARLIISDINNAVQPATLIISQSPRFIISNFYPAAGVVGSTARIMGFFGSNPIVTLNGVQAAVTASSSSAIDFQVPNTTTGKIIVRFGNINLSSTTNFIIGSPDSWVQLTNAFPQGERYDYGVSFVMNDTLYYGLGDNGGIYNYGFKIFDPVNNQWSIGPQIPAAMSPRRYASCFVLGAQVYIGLGVNNNQADWWRLDMPTQSWNQETSYPNDGFGGTSFVINNSAYVANPKDTDKLDRFNPAGLGSWDMINSSWPNSCLYSSFFTIGNYAYVAGGLRKGVPLQKAYRYDGLTNSVSAIADIPFTTFESPSFNLNNRGYILSNGRTFVYDPGLNTWSDAGINTPAFVGVYNAVVIKGNAYAWLADGTMYMLLLH